MSITTTPRDSVRLYRFSPFEVDLSKCELRKHGIRIRVERKPWQLLIALLDNAGEVVSRDQLREALWGPDVFVDFEHGLNVAVKKLRAALCDSPEKPNYVQTIAGEGYRFISAVESVPEVSEGISDSISGEGAEPPSIPFGAQLHRPLESVDSTPVHVAATSASKIYRFLALALILALAMVGFRARRPVKPDTSAGDWVLVSQFDNRTGDAGIDDIASYMLKVELSDSPLVRVVPQQRLVEILQMMRRPPDTRVDAAVGREICLRDGRIKALITGRIERLGARYLVNVLVVDPLTDTSITGFTDEASDKVAVLHALRQMSNRIREQLGEALPLIHSDNHPLASVTTSSLRALQLYSAAVTPNLDDNTHVDDLLSSALREDPKFASAYIDLAWAWMNRGKPPQIWLHVARDAIDLADALPERERYYITGSYYQMVGNQAEAVDAYESLLRLYPKHEEALTHLYELTRRKELLYRLAELHPESFQWNKRAWTKSNAENDRQVTTHFAQRAQRLATAEILESGEEPAEAAVKLAGAYELLSRGELPLAQAEVERVSAAWDVLGPRGKTSLAIAVGNFYFFLGQLQKAGSWYARTDPVSKRFYSAVLAEARGAPFSSSLVRIWDEDGTFCLFDPELAVRLASAGDLRWAQKLSGPVEEAFDTARAGLSDYSSLSKGAIELHRGNLNKAISLLTRANADLRAGPSIDVRIVGTRLVAAEALASALERKGDMRGAAEVLEPFEAVPIMDPADILGSPSETRFHLAQLYRKLGRAGEASKIESELRTVFADADPDDSLAELVHAVSYGQQVAQRTAAH